MLKQSALAVLATVCLTACGASTPQAAPIQTVTATVQATPSAASSPDDTDPPKQEQTPSGTTVEKKKLPDVVGMNLQKGQDTLQAAGFYVLNDKDATGRGRLQVFDRNWVVTRQSPAAGKRVSADTLITLYAKKIGE
ncbi:hypothetical protein GCM10022419_133710 [Nonomuraea rosea]|uniref:PASTA domain-containing protein n=1 Tax=Nonomuraea rosea TaxID=638574 RepID=A0ABP7A5Q0_9ACTN